ncbi:MAG: endonuclease III [Ignavibacteria bacterium]|nr:endonuclease III [Ignavibacteria bacterium]
MALKNQLVSVNNSLRAFFGVPPQNPVTPDPLTVLLGTILSQNTNDKNSYKAYQNLRSAVTEWKDAVHMSKEEIGALIKPAGLTEQKSGAILAVLNKVFVSKELVIAREQIKDLVDKEILAQLTSIQGVGIKTAACVLLFSLGRNVCPVDTHVHRILNRTGIVKTTSPEKTFWSIFDSIPTNSAHEFHTNLIKLGRNICTSQTVFCLDCPIKKICKFPSKINRTNVKFVSKDFLLLDSL